jgi:hypothetical protein
VEVFKVIHNKNLQLSLLFAVGVVLRLVPHAPNFTAVGAIALFAGAVLGKRAALLLPLAIMVASDLVIGFYPGITYTWVAFMLVACFGMAFRRAAYLNRVLLGGLGGGVIFFIVSNFGSWQAGGLYAPTMAGLAQCYLMALPFFGATLASSVIFSGILFGMPSEVRLRSKAAVMGVIKYGYV